jgi:hypothetical protein
MNQVGGWSTYTGSAANILAVILFVLAGILAYLGARLRRPIEPKRPGKYVGATLALIWVLGWLTFFTAAITYGQALIAQIGQYNPPDNPITPITFGSAFITFGVVALLSWQNGWRTALGSAIVATLAAPMIFELPFDLIVMGHTYPPAPAAQYTLLFFLPLFIIAFSAFALTTLSPVMTLSRYTLFALAGMFGVFGVWALIGFAYPAAPATIACNAISKVLSFATAITLFLPLNRSAAEENVSRGTSQAV